MNDNKLIEETNRIIAELVYPKYDLQKAYNYYNGKRDAELYRYLEDNFGIGNPTAVEFIPLIKKHVDALIGEYLGAPIIPKISCKDVSTITKMYREKELYITKEVYTHLKKHLRNSILSFIDGKDITDKAVELQLNNLIQDLDLNFISQYEIAAQNVIEYIMQSRDTDIRTKLKTLLLDLLVTGYTFYRVKESSNKNNVEIEVLNPLNTFIDMNPESPYIKDSYKVVVRKWLTSSQIINKYGRELSTEDIEALKNTWKDSFDSSTMYVRSYTSTAGEPLTTGIEAGKEITPGYPENVHRYNHQLIPVYEVEWLETDKDFVMQRYETIRIGLDIYIIKGKNENVIRSKDNPEYCSLSVNGVYFVNRNSEPYSLVLSCSNLQDKYDLLHYYRDNLIANSGTTGDFVDLSMLPSALGVTLPERLLKFIAYKKTGIAPIDTSLEGRLASGQAPINTIFNGYDDTVKVQAVQAIQLAIESVEQTASSITGVFRERLNGIQLRDAVTNVKTSVNNSYIITKPIFHLMDLVVMEILLDCLNVGKKVYKKGLTGTIILGDKLQKIFTALPEHFTTTDHDIRITTSTDVIRDLEWIKSIIPEFVKSLALAPDIIIEAATTKSLTDLKQKIQKALKKQKEENNQLMLLSQQVEQLNQLLQLSQQEYQKAANKIEQLNEAKMLLEQSKMQMENELEWFKAKTERDYKEATAHNDTQRTKIELAQLNDGNPYNDEVKNI